MKEGEKERRKLEYELSVAVMSFIYSNRLALVSLYEYVM